jgi:site-specific recombinase XerC
VDERAALSLESAITEYSRVKFKGLRETSKRSYQATLQELAQAFAGSGMAQFEPPQGTRLLRRFLDDRWGPRAARTYNKNLSVIQDFFLWHTREGRVSADPAGVIERKKGPIVQRAAFTDDQRLAVLRANPDVRDSVPLRLLLDSGVRKGGLQGIRFRDFDGRRHRVVVTTRGKVQTLAIPDEDFWVDLDRLRKKVKARDDDYLLPRQKTRRRRPKRARELDELYSDLENALSRVVDIAAELASTEAAVSVAKLSEALEFFQHARARAWTNTLYVPEQPLGEHGMHDWWYRCLGRAGIVVPGVVHGEGMHKARHTAGQRVLDKTGNLRAVQTQLGLGSVRSAAATYSNENADQLEATMHNVLRQLRGDDDPDAG